MKRALVVAVLFLAGCSAGSQAMPNLPNGNGAPASARAITESKSSIWAILSSPNQPPGTDGLYDDELRGVGGGADDDVWAVGEDCCYAHGSQEYTHALIEHWNGSAWKIVPFPKDEPADSSLRGVAEVSHNDVWAVGLSVFPNAALFEHWDGKTWKVVPSPYIYGGSEMLAVTAISSKNVWAAGEGNGAAILEHWNGTAWAYVPAYTMGGLTVLSGITASGPNDVTAVGEWYGPNANVFAEHWNGTSWVYTPPADNSAITYFAATSAAGKNDTWAVGYEDTYSQPPQTLTEHFDGSSWHLVGSPNKDPGGSYVLTNMLSGVAARSPKDVWAVGTWTYYPGSGTTRSLFERWNGKSWKVEPGPPPLEGSNNAAFNELLGATRVTSGTLWAVGHQVVPPNCCAETLTVRAAH